MADVIHYLQQIMLEFFFIKLFILKIKTFQ